MEQQTFGRFLLETGSDACVSPSIAVALDDALAERVGSGASPPTLRIWENGPALVLPRRHVRSQAAGTVTDRFGRRWPICARSSGGSTVAHGLGTLNVSLILPRSGYTRPGIENCYRLWIAILDRALRTAYGASVEAGPVRGAFCSGDYDALASGRKLAGTAQARRKKSVVVHGTILVRVRRTEYVHLIEAAEHGLGLTTVRGLYDPERMISLHELIGRAVSTRELAEAIGAAAFDELDHDIVSCEHPSAAELERAERLARELSDPLQTAKQTTERDR